VHLALQQHSNVSFTPVTSPRSSLVTSSLSAQLILQQHSNLSFNTVIRFRNNGVERRNINRNHFSSQTRSKDISGMGVPRHKCSPSRSASSASTSSWLPRSPSHTVDYRPFIKRQLTLWVVNFKDFFDANLVTLPLILGVPKPLATQVSLFRQQPPTTS
jgi:hypothetical protein